MERNGANNSALRDLVVGNGGVWPGRGTCIWIQMLRAVCGIGMVYPPSEIMLLSQLASSQGIWRCIEMLDIILTIYLSEAAQTVGLSMAPLRRLGGPGSSHH